MIRNFNLVLQVILCLTVFSSCFKEDDYDNVKVGDILTFDVNNQVVPADGTSTANIIVRVSKDAIPTRRSVVFKTDHGSFLGGKGDSLVVDAGGLYLAAAQLVATKIGNAKVTASIAGYKLENTTPITFIKAFPIAIAVKVDSFAIQNTFKSEIKILASLQAKEGVPTQGHPVLFSALTDSNTSIGFFLNGITTATTNNEGIASIRFSAGINGYIGRIRLLATSKKEDNSSISDTTFIYLTN